MGVGQSLCVWLVVVVVSCEEGLASKHHWETVMMRDGMRVVGRMSWVVMIPEDDWMCLDEVIDGLEGRGTTSDWDRMKLSSGSSPSMLLMDVVEPVVIVLLVL